MCLLWTKESLDSHFYRKLLKSAECIQLFQGFFILEKGVDLDFSFQIVFKRLV